MVGIWSSAVQPAVNSQSAPRQASSDQRNAVRVPLLVHVLQEEQSVVHYD